MAVYAIDFSMVFPGSAKAAAALKKAAAALQKSAKMPDDVTPAVESLADGSVRLRGMLRFVSEADRDALFNDLRTMPVKPSAPGRIGRHLCRHDEGKPCDSSEYEEWGDYGN